MTSCGMNNGPLRAEGIYPAVISCNLTNGAMPHISAEKIDENIPFITNEGDDRFIADISDGTCIGYKYFQFDGNVTLELKVRGTAVAGKSRFLVYTDEEYAGEIALKSSLGWMTESLSLKAEGAKALYLRYEGVGMIQLQEIRFV